ncbi:MAG: hypothetical protein ACT6S0_03215 [Roseateles sp.]|uniref:hypothetical protein n=1 Tax=Roseateles sp. TaxID=1971397 RepID=UPI004037345B
MAQRVLPTAHPPEPVTKRKVLWTFKTMTDRQRDCENWPTAVKPDAAQIKTSYPFLSDEEAEEHALLIGERFDRLAKAIRAYLTNGRLKPALVIAECGRESFYEQLNRCLTKSQHSDTIVGWAGLIYHLRLTPTQGKFRKWLDGNPSWKLILHRLIECGGGTKKVKLRKPTVETVSRAFIKAFKTGELAGESIKPVPIPLGTYPHTGGSNARGPVRRYIADYIATHLETTEVWFGSTADAKKGLGTGKMSFLLSHAPFDVIGGDCHTVDAIGYIILEGPVGPMKVPVKRMQVFIDACHTSRAATGWAVCIGAQIEARHVELAHLMASRPWKPKKLTVEGLRYAEGAGFPCGCVEGLEDGIQPAMKRLDNAVQHWAALIREDLRAAIGCAIAYGAVGSWWRNSISERLFGTLERFGFQRLPSSMGTGPQDVHRADDPTLEAKGVGIEWNELIEVLDVLLANYNATPHSALGNLSPLDYIRQSLNGRRPRWIPRSAPPPTALSPRLGWTVMRNKTIRGSVSKRTTPYIEVGEERYTGDLLKGRYDLIGRDATVHVPEDMRTVEAFLSSGESLGTLNVLHKGWSNVAHSLQDRQAFNQLVRDGQQVDRDDPIGTLAAHFEKKAVRKATQSGTDHISAEASELADHIHRHGVAPKAPKPASPAANAERFEDLRRARGIGLPEGW